MDPKSPLLPEVLPKTGLVVSEKGPLCEALCKPKILPIKSRALQRLEELEAQAVAQHQQQQRQVSRASTAAATRPTTRGAPAA